MTVMSRNAKEHAPPAEPPGLVRVVDDDASTCDSLRFFLESLGYAVSTWTDPVKFLDEVENDKRPGCLLLDIRMPAMSGLELLEKLSARKSSLPVIFLTGHGDVEMAVFALKHGAADFLLKPPQEEKLTAIIEAAVHQSLDARRLAEENLEMRRRWDDLTGREKDVVHLVAQGLMNKVIADRLGIAEKTVKQHRGSACRKLGVRNAVEVAGFLQVLDGAKPS